jgi:hypothetical protein
LVEMMNLPLRAVLRSEVRPFVKHHISCKLTISKMRQIL